MSCTPECWAMPECRRCGMVKSPRGRSIPLEAANGLCYYGNCAGYFEAPAAGHLWPGEAADDGTTLEQARAKGGAR